MVVAETVGALLEPQHCRRCHPCEECPKGNEGGREGSKIGKRGEFKRRRAY